MELTLLWCLPVIAAFIWPIALLFKKDTVYMAQYMMAIGQVLSGCSLLFYIAFYNDLISSHIVADLLYKLCIAFLVPVYYMFICGLTSREGVTRGNRMIFVPSIILILGIAMLFLILGPERYDYYMNNVIENGDFKLLPSLAYKAMVIIGYFGFKLFIIVQYIFFLVKSIPKMRQYNKEMEMYVSTKTNISKNGVDITVWIIISLSIVLLLLPYKFFEAELGFTYIGILIMTAMQLIIGHYSYNIVYTADQFDMMTDKQNNSKENTI